RKYSSPRCPPRSSTTRSARTSASTRPAAISSPTACERCGASPMARIALPPSAAGLTANRRSPDASTGVLRSGTGWKASMARRSSGSGAGGAAPVPSMPSGAGGSRSQPRRAAWTPSATMIATSTHRRSAVRASGPDSAGRGSQSRGNLRTSARPGAGRRAATTACEAPVTRVFQLTHSGAGAECGNAAPDDPARRSRVHVPRAGTPASEPGRDADRVRDAGVVAEDVDLLAAATFDVLVVARIEEVADAEAEGDGPVTEAHRPAQHEVRRHARIFHDVLAQVVATRRDALADVVGDQRGLQVAACILDAELQVRDVFGLALHAAAVQDQAARRLGRAGAAVQGHGVVGARAHLRIGPGAVAGEVEPGVAPAGGREGGVEVLPELELGAVHRRFRGVDEGLPELVAAAGEHDRCDRPVDVLVEQAGGEILARAEEPFVAQVEVGQLAVDQVRIAVELA